MITKNQNIKALNYNQDKIIDVGKNTKNIYEAEKYDEFLRKNPERFNLSGYTPKSIPANVIQDGRTDISPTNPNVDNSSCTGDLDLSDAHVSSLSNNDLLQYDATDRRWENRSFANSGLDDRYLEEANNLSDLDSVSAARTNLGLVAGGSGDIWVEKAGDTMTGVLKGFIKIDTRENILALTPDIQLAYASDTQEFYFANGTSWKLFPITLAPLIENTPDIANAMGRVEETYGYGVTELSNKRLHNIVFGNYNAPDDEGAIRYSSDATAVGFKKLELYLNGAWRGVVAWTEAELLDRIQWSDFVTFDKDIYGNDFIHGHRKDIGPFASEHLIFGGTF